MNHQQLRYVCEVAHRELNISKAAKALNISQPGISKQIRLLEEELGFEIFERTRNRISGITPLGNRVIELAQDAISQINQIQSIARDKEAGSTGSLVIATSHTQARYVLPVVLREFIALYPKVNLTLRHGSPDQIAEMLLLGEADLGVTTETERNEKSLVFLPCRRFERVLILPTRHPLLDRANISLAEIAQFPMIAYEAAYTGRHLVTNAFERAGLAPRIILSAIDADVIKTCVEQGLGVAILSEVTFQPERDTELRAIHIGQLVEPSITSISMRRQRLLRPYEYDFIAMCSSDWNRARVDKVLALMGRAI